jgi:hypothetical protein
MTPEAARAEIETLKGDKAFYARLQQQEADAHARWRGLHARAYPTPSAITSEADVHNQAVARREQGWSDFLAWQRQLYGLNEEQLTEMRTGICTPEVRAWAVEEKERLLRDAAWHQRFKSGEREARNHWGRVVGILGLRPVPLKDWPKVKP